MQMLQKRVVTAAGIAIGLFFSGEGCSRDGKMMQFVPSVFISGVSPSTAPGWLSSNNAVPGPLLSREGVGGGVLSDWRVHVYMDHNRDKPESSGRK